MNPSNSTLHTPHWTTSREMVFSAQSKYALQLPETFPLAVNFYKFTAAYPVVPNYHDFYEIAYFNSGEAVYCIADQKFTIRPGSIVFISAGKMHNFDVNPYKPIIAASIYFMPELLYHPGANPLETSYLLPFNTHSDTPPVLHEKELGLSTWQILMAMHNELSIKQDFYELALKNKLCEILLIVLRTMKERNMIQTSQPAQSRIERLSTVFEFIHEHYNTLIPLESLAALACMSPAYFCRYFKQLTGISPMNYTLRYRIDQAKKQLIHSSLSITEISFNVGFNSPSYFNRAFQRFTKMNPRTFRQTYATESAAKVN